MKRNKKKGFTLVELLAVIVILAIILVIAVPKVMSVIEDSKKATLESTAKMIASSAEKQKVQNTVLGNTKEITCDSVAKINKGDYASCSIEFENNTAKVTIEGSGKFDGLYVCGGTKTSAVAIDNSCPIAYGIGSTYIKNLLAQEETLNNGLIVDDTDDQNIRYAGATENVKNKVYFNCAETDGTNAYGSENYDYESSCEIWRIIGVFDTKSTDSEIEDAVPRIKIVRDEMLDTRMEWSSSSAEWIGSKIEENLNSDEESYYNNLSSITKEFISDALWYLSAASDGSVKEVYEKERSGLPPQNRNNMPTIWVGKIGLIYPSDFGFAGTNCGEYTLNNYSNENSCGKTRNWLTPPYLEDYWTITVNEFNDMYAAFINEDGRVKFGTDAYNPRCIRPTLYLSHNVKIISGNGDTEPYILAT